MVSYDFLDMSLVLSYNPGHKILELCNILEKFGFTTTKAVLNNRYKKRIKVPSRVAERLTVRK